MAILGVVEHHVLGFSDGGLRHDDRDGIEEIGRLIDAVRPDTILTFGADGMTFHPDHIAVHHWATTAWQQRGRKGRLLYATTSVEFLARFREEFEKWDMYMTDERPTGVPADELSVHVHLGGTELDRKLAALRAMGTQTSALIEMLGPDAYAEQVCEEWFVDAERVRANGSTGSEVDEARTTSGRATELIGTSSNVTGSSGDVQRASNGSAYAKTPERPSAPSPSARTWK
jgi:LmbE family N-acetylglucosaminyl deacetylase